jgi:DNA polymerase III subunit epsilon
VVVVWSKKQGAGVRQVFLDTETTGLNAEQGDRIVEIGCIELFNRRSTGKTFHHYVNPQRSSHPDAVRVHGITDDFLADKPLFASIAPELLAFVADAEIIIHNASFDIAFLNAELARLDRGPFTEHVGNVTDSLQLAREIYPGKANSLDALCKRLEVDSSQREKHGALLDASLLAEVYLRMTRGQDMLVIDGTETANVDGSPQQVATDLRQFDLPVLLASEDELAAHETVLVELDKSSKGQTVWRQTAAA